MSGTPDHDRKAARPFLIETGVDGEVSLSLQETRYNSLGYPVVTATRVGEPFATAAAARAWAKAHYGAKAGDFATG